MNHNIYDPGNYGNGYGTCPPTPIPPTTIIPGCNPGCGPTNRPERPEHLRYEITDWSQVNECLSNNSRDLRMRFIQIMDDELCGKLILVEHAVYGTLFACLVQGEGSILSTCDPCNPCGLTHVFSEEEILRELYKFGFDIRFKKEKRLTGDQLDYLMNLNNLGFDKIRCLNVVLPYAPHAPKYRPIVVGFMVGSLPKWLDNTYACPESEYNRAIGEGTAINITAISQAKKFDWSFLKDHVLSINDILAINS